MQTDYRTDIDGLRAIAVLGVIIWHAGLSFQDRLIFPGGFLGVDVFFVISGFLMARIWDGEISIRDFAKRRLRRILPMLFVTILACIPFALWLMGRSAQADFGADTMASTLLVPNIFYGFQDSYWAAPGKLRPLLHVWTIGVEMQFYLLCPLVFLGLKKWKKPVIGLSLISIASFSIALWLSKALPDFAFYNLPTRLWEFGLGALIFYSPKFKTNAQIIRVIGLALILGSLLFLTELIRHPGLGTLLPVIGTSLVIAGGRQTSTPLLSNPFIRRIGLISFSAYLIHQPLFVFTRIAAQQTELPALINLGLIILTLVLSELTYRFVETPLRQAGKMKGVFIASLGLFALTGGLLTYQNAQSHWNSEALSQKPERWILNTDGTRCVNKVIDHPCRLGNSDMTPTIALLGDSHMQAMGGGFDELFIANGINDIDFSMGGCPFIMSVRRYARKYPCDEFVEGVFTELKARKIKSVVILDRRNAYLLGEGATFNDGTKEIADTRLYPVSLGPDNDTKDIQAEVERLHIATIQRLRKMGIRIIMIYPVPEIGIHVPDTLLERLKTGNLPLTLDRQLHENRQAPLATLKDLAANDKNILEINPARTLCDDNICATHNDTDIYYTDRDHLSREGTKLILEEYNKSIIEFIDSSPDAR